MRSPLPPSPRTQFSILHLSAPTPVWPRSERRPLAVLQTTHAPPPAPAVPGHHLVRVTSNSVFPSPMCSPPPCPLHVTLTLLPTSALAWSPYRPLHTCLRTPGRTTAGHWGRRSSRPASSAWATTWRMTGRYAPPGPPRTMALTALLSLSPSLCLASLTIPPFSVVCSISPALLPPPYLCLSGHLPPYLVSRGRLCLPCSCHCPVFPLCTWGGPSCLLWARPPLLSLRPEQKQTGSMDSDDFRALLISTGYSLVRSLRLPRCCAAPPPPLPFLRLLFPLLPCYPSSPSSSSLRHPTPEFPRPRGHPSTRAVQPHLPLLCCICGAGVPPMTP